MEQAFQNITNFSSSQKCTGEQSSSHNNSRG